MIGRGVVSEAERKLLEYIAEKKLLTRQEINEFLRNNGYNQNEVNLMRLHESGYMRMVEGMGTVFIVTKKGQEFLRD